MTETDIMQLVIAANKAGKKDARIIGYGVPLSADQITSPFLIYMPDVPAPASETTWWDKE